MIKINYDKKTDALYIFLSKFDSIALLRNNRYWILQIFPVIKNVFNFFS